MEAATGGSASSNKYHLLTSLGRGGMAEVFLAVAAGPGAFNKLLVLKLLRTEAYRSSGELTRMFLDEARLSARLNHPNIVQTYEIGELLGRYFIAMEYLEGQTLREVQRRLRGASLPLGEALRVITK
ncbi:MAG TPA: protein kinase, partial [Kofleriaceae bacterium]|nr:protein kinase [Kofleriaceae bacterium]